MRIVYAMLEISAAAVVFVPVYICLSKAVYHSGKTALVYFLLSCYMAGIYSLVGLPNITYIRPGLNLNLIPFWGIWKDLKNCLLNALLFVPLGALLPLIWARFRRRSKILQLGFFLSAAIELLQILVTRATDVNDVIMNVTGTLAGYWTAMGLLKWKPEIMDLNRKEKYRDLYGICLITGVTMCMIQPFLYTLLWELMYGSH